jgi:hypothetical protein
MMARSLAGVVAVVLLCVGCTSGSIKASPSPARSSPTQATKTVVIGYGTAGNYVPRTPVLSSLAALRGAQECHYWIHGLINQGGETTEVDLTVVASQATSIVTRLTSQYPEVTVGLAGPSLKPRTSLPPVPKVQGRPNDAGPLACADAKYTPPRSG